MWAERLGKRAGRDGLSSRSAVAHGIEHASAREAVAKLAVGTLSMRARGNTQDYLHAVVEDMERGLDFAEQVNAVFPLIRLTSLVQGT